VRLYQLLIDFLHQYDRRNLLTPASQSPRFVTPQPHFAAGRGSQALELRPILLLQQVLNFAKAGAIFPKGQLAPNQAISHSYFLELVVFIFRDIKTNSPVASGKSGS